MKVQLNISSIYTAIMYPVTTSPRLPQGGVGNSFDKEEIMRTAESKRQEEVTNSVNSLNDEIRKYFLENMLEFNFVPLKGMSVDIEQFLPGELAQKIADRRDIISRQKSLQQIVTTTIGKDFLRLGLS